MEDGFRSGQRSTVAFALWLCMGGPIIAARFALRARLQYGHQESIPCYPTGALQSSPYSPTSCPLPFSPLAYL